MFDSRKRLLGNKVGAAGAASLASALEKNATLQRLDLDGNEVGAAGAASLKRLRSALDRNQKSLTSTA